MAAAIERLERCYRLAVLSDSDRVHLDASIGRSGLSFAVVLCSEDMGVYKPHSDAFKALRQRFEVQPGDVLVVGDTPRSDVAGAQRSSMLAAWLNRQGTHWPGHLRPPLVEAADLVQLEAWLG